MQRQECIEDGHGALVAITSTGRTAIERAAPGHVRAVRNLVFDALGENEIDGLEAAIDAMAARLD